MTTEPAIRVQNVSKNHHIYAHPQDRLKQMVMPRIQKLARRTPSIYFEDFPALTNVTFDIGRGETVGIVGRNGSGKSTILQIICGILNPTAGSVEVNGRIAALLELGAGFNPEFTGRENVFLNGAILGLDEQEMAARFDGIADFAGIGDFIERPVKTYSSGMYVRLAFAVAINVDPDILVIDEALAVGDVAFQRKCFARLEQISDRGGTILFVSHSTSTIVEICDRAILLDGGELLLDGKPKKVTNQYLKLVHMPVEKLADARETIKALRDLPDDVQTEETLADSPGKAPALTEETNPELDDQALEKIEGWYDPHLISKSVVEYESQGAIIRDVRIFAASGRQVNVLKMGQKYSYEYFVDFKKPVENISFGMMIKSVNGIELSGANNTKCQTNEVKQTAFGQTVKVSFEFECRLMPGSYFGTAGIVGTVEAYHGFIHRHVDKIAFQILPGSELSLFDVGYFGLNSKFNAITVDTGTIPTADNLVSHTGAPK